MRRIWWAVLAALSVMLVVLPVASAGASWCEDDPPVQIVTPHGNKVIVHVHDYGMLTGNAELDRQIRRAVASAQITVDSTEIVTTFDAVANTPQVGTMATLTITIPSAYDRVAGTTTAFDAWSEIRLRPNQPGTVYPHHTSGQSQTVSFFVPVL